MKICILGTDKRNEYLREYYKEDLVDVTKAKMVVTPIPFSKDGIHVTGEKLTCEELIDLVKEKDMLLVSGGVSPIWSEKLKGVRYYPITSYDEVAMYNAIPTAEGAIAQAMQMTDFTLHQSNIMVLGFGNIGKILSKMLHGIGANVFCEARAPKDIAFIEAMGYNSVRLEELDRYLPNMQIVFNTIPAMILNKERLNQLNSNCIVIDLASNPGGTDFEYANALGIHTALSLGLPAKVAPRSAARYLKVAIDQIIRTNER